MTMLSELRLHSRKSSLASCTAQVRLMGMSKIKAALQADMLEMHSAALHRSLSVITS